jgi:hypothetical protein
MAERNLHHLTGHDLGIGDLVFLYTTGFHRRPQRVSRCPRSFKWLAPPLGKGARGAKAAPGREGRFVLPSCWPQRSSRSCPCSRTLLLCVQPGTVGREEEYYPIAGSAWHLRAAVGASR